MKMYVSMKDFKSGDSESERAYRGLVSLGIEVKKIDLLDQDLALGPDTGFVGDMFEMKMVLGERAPKVTSYPGKLKKFLERKVWKSTVGEVEKEVLAGKKYFVKPFHDKLFCPAIVTSDDVEVYFMHLEPETPVFVADPVVFASEFRVFVCEGEILGIKQTSGSRDDVEWQNVDFDVIKDAVKVAGNGIPRNLIMDFGLMEHDGGLKTALVECNPGYSFGTYGLPKEKIAKFLIASWKENVKEEFVYHPKLRVTIKDFDL